MTTRITSSIPPPANLPPPILTSEPGSFARRTFEVRIPKIVLDTIQANAFPPEIVGALHALHEEILSGVIQPLHEDAPDRAFWDEHTRANAGRSWLDVPWYWAESFFYRRMLEATHYFQPGAWYHRDPYANQKDGELAPEAGPHALAAILDHLPFSPAEKFRTLLHASVWGNRADLSYNVAQDKPGSLTLEREHENLVVDDTTQVWEHLRASAPGEIHFLCDNAGTELLFDLALADFLLQGLATRVTLHLKPQPYFVSDAMIKDANAALDALAQAPAESALAQMGKRLTEARVQSRLVLSEHAFAVEPLFYFQMPADLHGALAGSSLAISKGDANYRRLLGDAHWDPTTPFAQAVAYFPAPLVALRTLKSELIVGLSPGQVARLTAEDPDWMVNGKRGLIEMKNRRGQ